MDFGIKIGRYSKQTIPDKFIKLKKLRKARSLLEWLASKSNAEFYTTTHPIRGFENVKLANLQKVLS
jgi:uncharacterized Rossmann fold enzyme